MVREDKAGKYDHIDYTDPFVDERYAEHMRKGALVHGSANWKKGGYGKINYLKSLERHLKELQKHELYGTPLDEDHAAAIRFNITGYMYEDLSPDPTTD